MKKRIALFLWRIAVRLIEPQRGKVVGLPYNRDPENPCEYYEPGKHGQWAFKDCETDGIIYVVNVVTDKPNRGRIPA